MKGSVWVAAPGADALICVPAGTVAPSYVTTTVAPPSAIVALEPPVELAPLGSVTAKPRSAVSFVVSVIGWRNAPEIWCFEASYAESVSANVPGEPETGMAPVEPRTSEATAGGAVVAVATGAGVTAPEPGELTYPPPLQPVAKTVASAAKSAERPSDRDIVLSPSCPDYLVTIVGVITKTTSLSAR